LFFVRFLTDPGDVVLDPFAGSNTTGEICEAEGRNWIAFDLDKEYLETSRYRFEPRPADTTGTATTNGKAQGAHSRRGRPKNRASYANGQVELFP
jgi:DNA modification methylase